MAQHGLGRRDDQQGKQIKGYTCRPGAHTCRCPKTHTRLGGLLCIIFLWLVRTSLPSLLLPPSTMSGSCSGDPSQRTLSLPAGQAHIHAAERVRQRSMPCYEGIPDGCRGQPALTQQQRSDCHAICYHHRHRQQPHADWCRCCYRCAVGGACECRGQVLGAAVARPTRTASQ